ncbi:conserved hypothetical protein [Trichinella spiralis]|uniref:hypothetical protein n=1 Tax=Trichinella spiralis TaxID=6334 RepID=UPI0001EFB9F9|nr:conserved hypothetical protein [Trichinella spiralis]
MLPRPSLRVLRNRCLLNVLKHSHRTCLPEFSCKFLSVTLSHSRTCLPENVCKFLFHCYAYVSVTLMSLIAGLRSAMKIMDHPHLYEREYKNYVKASKAFISEQNDGIFLSCEILRLTTAAYEK